MNLFKITLFKPNNETDSKINKKLEWNNLDKRLYYKFGNSFKKWIKTKKAFPQSSGNSVRTNITNSHADFTKTTPWTSSTLPRNLVTFEISTPTHPFSQEALFQKPVLQRIYLFHQSVSNATSSSTWVNVPCNSPKARSYFQALKINNRLFSIIKAIWSTICKKLPPPKPYSRKSVTTVMTVSTKRKLSQISCLDVAQTNNSQNSNVLKEVPKAATAEVWSC